MLIAREGSGEQQVQERADEATQQVEGRYCLGAKAAACLTPISTKKSNVMSDKRRSPYSMTHMGSPPPPPPSITPITGEIPPPQQLREVEISPIERKKED